MVVDQPSRKSFNRIFIQFCKAGSNKVRFLLKIRTANRVHPFEQLHVEIQLTYFETMIDASHDQTRDSFRRYTMMPVGIDGIRNVINDNYQ